jgi:hypothetical protein
MVRIVWFDGPGHAVAEQQGAERQSGYAQAGIR